MVSSSRGRIEGYIQCHEGKSVRSTGLGLHGRSDSSRQALSGAFGTSSLSHERHV